MPTEQIPADSIEWEEPPAETPAPPPGKYGAIGQTLMENPGQWARVKDVVVRNRHAHSVQTSLKRTFPNEVFEVRFGPGVRARGYSETSQTYPMDYPLYLRYVGPDVHQH